MCPDLFEQMRDALQLAGLSDKTQAAYLRAVRLLCDHHHTPPQSICEGQLRAYFLFRRNFSRWSGSSPTGGAFSPPMCCTVTGPRCP